MSKDIRHFFGNNTNALPSKITTRLWGVRGFLQGKLSLTEVATFFRSGFPSKIPLTAWKKLLAEYINADGTANLYGKPFSVPFGNYGDFLVLVHQIIIDDQYRVRTLVKKGAVVIDGGANMGVFAVFVANEIPDATVYAFEPSPETFRILSANAEQYPSIHSVQIGLAEKKDRREFQSYDNSTVSNHFVSEGFEKSKTASTTILELVTLDDFAKEQRLPRIDFIKLDTEGYEANILKGGIESIGKWKPAMVMSAYHRPNDKIELPAIVHSIYPNYRCEVHSDNEEDLVCVAD